MAGSHLTALVECEMQLITAVDARMRRSMVCTYVYYTRFQGLEAQTD